MKSLWLRTTSARTVVGNDVYEHVSRTAVALYKEATTYATSRGLILADTKFEFGLLPSPSTEFSTSASPSPTLIVDGVGHKLILIDEALTPDSSRYWSLDGYNPGTPQASFDKQYLRDWLVSSAGFRKGLESGPADRPGEGWVMSPEVVEGTRERYETAVKLLTG